MALHNQLGREGEQLAEQYFIQMGFNILFRNWKYGRNEIDLIAAKNNILHFIEVKTRRSALFGLPEEDVDRRKLRCMVNAGEGFQRRYPHWKRIQFDILAITFVNEKPEYFLIEDVYL